MKKTTQFTALGLSSIALLMAGCKSDAKSALTITDSITDKKDQLIEEFTSLNKQEKDLQPLFEKTLEEDDEFATLRDGSSPVFENIQYRHDILEKIDELKGSFEQEQDSLQKLDEKELPKELTDEVRQSLGDLSKQLTAFQKFYSDSLSNQKNYFESLADEKATYETFTDGLSSLNEKQEESNQHIVELDETVNKLNKANTDLHDQLEEQMEKK